MLPTAGGDYCAAARQKGLTVDGRISAVGLKKKSHPDIRPRHIFILHRNFASERFPPVMWAPQLTYIQLYLNVCLVCPGDSWPPWSCNYFITNNYSPLLCECVQQFWLSCQLPVELSMTAIDLTRETKPIQAGSWLLLTVVRRDSKREEVSGRLPSRSVSQPRWISNILDSSGPPSPCHLLNKSEE